MALLFTTLLGISSCILVYLIFAFNSEGFIRETETAIDMDLADSIELQRQFGDAAFVSLLDRKSKLSNGRFYLLLDTENHKIAGNLNHLPSDTWPMAEGIIRFSLEDAQMAAKIYTFDDGNRLLLARDIGKSIQNFQRIQWLCGLVIGLMLVVVMTSFFISTFVVSRINRIAATAHNIMETGDLTRRITIDSSWDDLSNLAMVLNAFLARIEQLMAGIRQVSDNIAHDLRTPLTRLRNRLEEYAEKQPAAAREECERQVQEADQLLETFNALLRITNIQTGKRHAGFKAFAFDRMLMDVIELYEPLAEEKKIIIEYKIEPYEFYGDPHLMFQAVANILHNAIRFSPESGNIAIALQAMKQGAELSITDRGPGIPDAEKPKVFDRFYRADSSRQSEGNGLGLSLVAAIAGLHGISIELNDANPGLKVTLRM